MKNREGNAFKTTVITILSILSVLVFIIYIFGFILLQSYTFTPRKTQEIEVIEITEKEFPNTWTVLLKFESEGKKVMATMNIEAGQVVGEKH